MRPLSHLLFAGLCLALAALVGPSLAADAPAVEVGKPAPPIELSATQIQKVLPDKKDARKLTLKDFEGKV